MHTQSLLTHTLYNVCVYCLVCRKLKEENGALKGQLESEKQKNQSMGDNLQ